jgi:nucleoside-diphosphate-sugar epimerase
MRVLVTGAGGFVGRALLRRLLGDENPVRATDIVVVDQHLDVERDPWLSDTRVTCLEGNLADDRVLDLALEPAPQIVYHLASVPGSLAEREPRLGLQVNLHGALALLERLAMRRDPPQPAPRVVFASTVAVYGALHGVQIGEDQPSHPELSYGAHKLMSEILLMDLSRRGELDGVSLRLPGIIARPRSPTGHGSAFMSDLFHLVGTEAEFVCPVGPDASCWWMSLQCCVDNFLHAARLPGDRLPFQRVVQLPVLSATVDEVVRAVQVARGRPGRVQYRPDDNLERLFGRYPPLSTPLAHSLGFAHDGSLADLARRGIANEAWR